MNLLSHINSPKELRNLRADQLPQLCSEIREYMIDNLSHNPGHFGSSMGAVEIIVALHYVFDTPRDRLVWDVGHQAYAHKLLTGRRDLSRIKGPREESAASHFQLKANMTLLYADMREILFPQPSEWQLPT